MPDLTKAFGKAYDGLRKVILATPSNLRLLDDDGAELATITQGWTVDEVSSEEQLGRIVEVRITDRVGVEFEKAVFFVWGGYQYERAAFPNPPATNPREWVWRVKPVGVDPDL